MGLDASVMCNCFRDGKTTPPPFPRDWLEIDKDGCLNLKKEHESNENGIQLDAWEQFCCEHQGMDFVSEAVANWPRYRAFQEALGDVGWQHFPVLKEQLPNTNDGLTPPAASADALLELDVFTSAGDIGTKTVLVDTATGEVLYEHIAAYRGVFIFSSRRGINVGLSEFEFFAVDTTSGEDVFRATRFRQFSKSGTEVTGTGDDLVWEDLDTGIVYESGIAIDGKKIPWEDGRWQNSDGSCRYEYPSEFHVEQRPRTVTDFDDIVRALRSVFGASVRTGNPVRWS